MTRVIRSEAVRPEWEASCSCGWPLDSGDTALASYIDGECVGLSCSRSCAERAIRDELEAIDRYERQEG